MMRFAEQKAVGSRIFGAGIRYGRVRSLSVLCRAARATGANAYMTAVAPVTTLTSLFQLGNGPNAISPTTAASRIDHTGTPRLSTLARTLGISDSSPRAYDSRALVPTYTMPVPAGEMTASMTRTVASQEAPTASARVYQAP